LLNIFHEISLFLVNTGGEAFLIRGIDGSLNVTTLLLGLRNGLLLCGTCLAALFASQVLAEIGVCAALMVEIDSVS